MTGAVTKVTVTFHGLTHSTVNDIDAMVVAPTGAEPRGAVRRRRPEHPGLRDQRHPDLRRRRPPGPVPTGNIPTGTYRPTNTPAAPDAFPAPAPAPVVADHPGRAFTGINANGTWQLFVVDDATGDLGTMAGGWSLTITTEVAAVATTTDGHHPRMPPSITGEPVTFTATVQRRGQPRHRRHGAVRRRRRHARRAGRPERLRPGHPDHQRPDRGHPRDPGHLQRRDRLPDQQRHDHPAGRQRARPSPATHSATRVTITVPRPASHPVPVEHHRLRADRADHQGHRHPERRCRTPSGRPRRAAGRPDADARTCSCSATPAARTRSATST